MIPVPFIVLGVAATSLGVRHLRKKSSRKEIDENRKNFEAWCRRQRLVPKADGVFDLNAYLPNGNPLIIEALIQERNDIFEYLIAQHADVNAMNSEGKTALFYCKCFMGEPAQTDLIYYSKVKKLIEAGADVNARDSKGRTAIFDCRVGIVVNILLEQGADLLIQDEEGRTVLHALSTAENDLTLSLKFAKLYINRRPELLKIVDNKCKKAEICELYFEEEQYTDPLLDDEEKKLLLDGKTDACLCYAVIKGNYYLSKVALEFGSNPNYKYENINNYNMLEVAAKYNNPHLIPLLIQYGADVNAKNGNFTALKRAVESYHPECVKKLLDCGAKIDEDTIGMAKDCIHPEIYSLICKTDKMPVCENIPDDINLKNCSQSLLNQYLHRAIDAYDIEAVHRLLNAGADPNGVVASKWMLEMAVEKNAPEIIQALIDAGADINKNFIYRTALWCAYLYHHDRCVELLLELGAKWEGYSFLLEHNDCARIREIWRKYKSKNAL